MYCAASISVKKNYKKKKLVWLIPLSIAIATLTTIIITYNHNENSKNDTINYVRNGLFNQQQKQQRHLQEEPQQQKISLNSINLSKFSSDILTGYATCSDFKNDIIEGLKYIINESLERNIKEGVVTEPRPKIMYAMAPSGAETKTTQSSGAKGNGVSEDSYDTNNQVDGVDEVDMVKSDGMYIYAVYGKEIIVVNKDTGSVVSRITIPKIKKNKLFSKINHWDYMDNNDDSMWAWGRAWMPPYYINEDTIRGLLLDNGKLVVIVSSYNYGDAYPKIISSERTTTFTYDISTNTALSGEELVLTLLNTKELHGAYNNGRSISGKVYITSNTYIDIYKLSSPIDRYNPIFWYLDDNEYKTRAKAIINELLPDFAMQLHDELLLQQNQDDGSSNIMIDENSCKFIVKLSLMQPKNANSDEYDNHGTNLLRNFAQVSSFNIHSSNSLVQFQGGTSLSGMMLPTNDMDIYANNDMLIIGGRGYEKSTQNDYWEDYTFIVGFDLLNGMAIPSAIGKIKGYLLNQFSFDYYDNHLRVATTTNAKWGYIGNENGKEKYGEVTPSTNQVYILQKQGNDLVTVNEITNLGVSERIYSVRFINERGYIVTFRTIDPLYILDLSQPGVELPNRIMGELKITGFSNYLHPVDSTTILGIGQDADEKTGQRLGLQISLFDISNNNPTLIQKAVVENSYSNAQYDHHAFRYLPLNQILIIPVSSTYNQKKDELFDGFYVYKIDKVNGIYKIGQVVHADEQVISFYKCFSDVYMDPRSLVFDSKLITLKGHSIINSGDIFNINDDGSNYEWLMNFDSKNNKSCMNWFPWA